MANLVFKGLVETNASFDEFVKKELGWVAIREGQDWIIRSDDSAFLKGPGPLIHLVNCHDIPSTISGRAELANLIASHDDPTLYKNMDGKNINLDHFPAYGMRAELYIKSAEFLLAQDSNLIPAIKDLLDFTTTYFNSSRCFILTTNLRRHQAMLSTLKIAYLTTIGSPTEAAQLSLEQKAFQGAFPTPSTLRSFYEPFLIFNPRIMAIPFDRFSLSLVFTSQTDFAYPFVACSSLHQQVMNSQNPYADSGAILFNREHLSQQFRGYLIGLALDAVNNIYNYLTDCRNFISGNDTIDLYTQLRMLSGVWHAFADFTSLAATSDPHARANLAFGVIDKLANIISHLSGVGSADETKVAKSFFSTACRKSIVQILNRQLRPVSKELSDLMTRLVNNAYRGFLLKSQPVTDEFVEENWLSRVWAFRNLKHGPFLRKDQYEALFREQAGDLPGELFALVYFLVLAFCIDTKRFISLYDFASQQSQRVS